MDFWTRDSGARRSGSEEGGIGSQLPREVRRRGRDFEVSENDGLEVGAKTQAGWRPWGSGV